VEVEFFLDTVDSATNCVVTSKHTRDRKLTANLCFRRYIHRSLSLWQNFNYAKQYMQKPRTLQ